MDKENDEKVIKMEGEIKEPPKKEEEDTEKKKPTVYILRKFDAAIIGSAFGVLMVVLFTIGYWMGHYEVFEKINTDGKVETQKITYRVEFEEKYNEDNAEQGKNIISLNTPLSICPLCESDAEIFPYGKTIEFDDKDSIEDIIYEVENKEGSAFVRCTNRECGLRTDTYSALHIEWAVLQAIEAWNTELGLSMSKYY